MHRSGRERLSRQAARHRQAVFACEGVDAAMNAEIENATEEIELKLLLEALWQRYQVDFRGYALSSIKRRMSRARQHFQCDSLSMLQHRALNEPAVFSALLGFLTLHVSEMFRIPSFFRNLRDRQRVL